MYLPKKVTGGQVASGLSWRFAERILAQLVSTLVSILLARQLMPGEYGAVALILVFINIANVFVTSGFGQSLIQDKNAGDVEFSTMTIVSVAVSVALYVLIFISAPFIAAFYKMPELSALLRVLALKLPLSGYNSVQQAYIQRNMMFKKFFFSTLGGTIISGIIGVAMAYMGFGAWALVAQYLINSAMGTVILHLIIGWHPRWRYSAECAKRLFSFSWKLTVGDLLGTIYIEIKSLLVGKAYTTVDLAYFNKGEQFPKLIISNVNSSVISVLYPAMSKVNDSLEDLKDMTRKSIRASSFFLFPALVGLCVTAQPFVRVVLTEKWDECVPFLQLACISNITVPLSSANLQAMKALGRSDLTMWLEVIKKSIGLVLVLASLPFGPLAIAWSGVIYSVIALLANALPNRKLLNYSYKEQFGDLLPFAGMSGIMGIFVYPMTYLPVSELLVLVLQVITGVFVYAGLAYYTKNDIMMRLLQIVIRRVSKMKPTEWIKHKLQALLHLLIYYISAITPKDKRLWVFGAWAGKLYSDNSKYLFIYVRENAPNIKAVWITRSKDLCKKMQAQGLPCFYYYSPKAILTMIRAGAVFTTAGRTDTAEWAHARCQHFALWHGTVLKKIGYDNTNWQKIKGVTRPKVSKLKRMIMPYSKPDISNDVFPVSSPEAKKNIVSSFRVDPSQVFVTGQPRNDVFKNKPENEYIMKLKESHPGAKLICYLPTHRNFGSKNNTPITEDVLRKTDIYLRENNIIMIYKPHFHEMKHLSHLETGLTNIILGLDEDLFSDVYTYLPYCDLLISDYSSVYIDFLCSGKPIVLFAYDLEDYIASDAGFYYDYDDIAPGKVCRTWQETLDTAIAELGTDTRSQKYRQIAERFNEYFDDRNCERVYELATEKLGIER